MNNEYRQFLINNTNSIMAKNFYNHIQHHSQYQYDESNDITMKKIKVYPYLFNGIHDTNIPPGYETSRPKEIYLSQQRLDSEKRIRLQKNY
jgi:hypothetical protein